MNKYGVLYYIGNGKENAITRTELCKKTGLVDRHIREHIEQLRKEGYLILNDGDGTGYYRLVYDEANKDKLEQYYWSECRRAISTLVRLKMLRKFLVEHEVDMNPNHKKGISCR